MSMFGLTPCVVCKKAIYGAPVKDGSKLWHQACFVCTHCKCKLQVTDYKSNQGQLYCGHCFKVNLRSVNDSAHALAGKGGSAPSVASPRSAEDASAPAPPSGGATGTFCGSCGTPSSGTPFCGSCGAKMS